MKGKAGTKRKGSYVSFKASVPPVGKCTSQQTSLLATWLQVSALSLLFRDLYPFISRALDVPLTTAKLNAPISAPWESTHGDGAE